MARKKNPPKPAQKWFAASLWFFVPEITSEFLLIGLDSIRAASEEDAIVQASQFITRNWYDIESESYITEEGAKMLPWKLVVVEIPGLFAKRLEEEWMIEKHEEREESHMPTSQAATVLDFPIHPKVPDGTPTPPVPPGKPDSR